MPILREIMKKPRCIFLLFPLLFLFPGCKSAPPPGEPPVSELVFERIEAENISRAALYYRLRVFNPRPFPLTLKIKGWKVLLDGLDYNRKDAALLAGESAAEEAQVSVPPEGSAEKILRLDLDLEAYRNSPPAEDSGNYRAEVLLNLIYQYETGKALSGEAAGLALFPRIREPEFTITAIAIMQAELINTRFRVSLRIDNPNIFPVDLSSFGYELYGAGRFWAGGREDDILHIPARGSAETRLFLMMNFINMKRSLLDEVIALREVRYRFTGEAEVGTGVAWLPWFHMGFDQSGNSAVYK
jgi:LEA14-like dessication related protein